MPPHTWVLRLELSQTSLSTKMGRYCLSFLICWTEKRERFFIIIIIPHLSLEITYPSICSSKYVLLFRHFEVTELLCCLCHFASPRHADAWSLHSSWNIFPTKCIYCCSSVLAYVKVVDYFEEKTCLYLTEKSVVLFSNALLNTKIKYSSAATVVIMMYREVQGQSGCRQKDYFLLTVGEQCGNRCLNWLHTHSGSLVCVKVGGDVLLLSDCKFVAGMTEDGSWSPHLDSV